ncbi:hypothetical protein PHJA_000988700 [Phtheirospermum japonicum]|uniref:Uncharacterized protein n=1 Tax=Phtheirospermum japonicum TaxID=374723 RepID=A0A830BLH8_9LAMI|nr:hypothetical protein PHJA_000988700 [Phtheirospermum japonicum]
MVNVVKAHSKLVYRGVTEYWLKISAKEGDNHAKSYYAVVLDKKVVLHNKLTKTMILKSFKQETN